MQTSFDKLPPSLKEALFKAFQIDSPLPIQENSYDFIAGGKDVILQSRTGSGKTLAYLLPLLAILDPTVTGNHLLICAPSQELSVQIANVIRALNVHLQNPYTLALLGGGANIQHQIEKLKSHPQILIGTPGRLLALFERRKINAQTIETVVYDEVDAIISQENGRLFSLLQKNLRKSTQKIAVSASIPASTQSFLEKMMPEAECLRSSGEAALNPNIGHFIMRCEERKKFDYLRRTLAVMDGKTLIFLNGDDDIVHLKERLLYHHIPAAGLSADMKKLDRQKTLENFRKQFEGILISSDLSARGLDIENIDQVINMDFPHDPLTYVHRVGRTGRGTATGAALSFVAEKDEAAIRIYKRDLGIDFTEVHLKEGAIVVGAPEKKEPKAQTNNPTVSETKSSGKHRKTTGKRKKSKGKPKRLKRGDQ